ncbi:hypothetical protein SLE2022_309880 [Rubroshorea leprosula]
MYRAASSRLRSLNVCVELNPCHAGNSVAVRYATSAVAARPSSPGFFSWLTGERSSSLPPLDTPLKGVPFPSVLPDFIPPSGTKIFFFCTNPIAKGESRTGGNLKKSSSVTLGGSSLHGYDGALGNPFLANESALDRLNGSILRELVVENYTDGRMVLAASGVVHEQLLQIAEPLLSNLPAGTYLEEPKSYYVGGHYRQQADSPSTHFALAFEFFRCSWEEVAHFQAVVQGKRCTHGCVNLRVLNAHQQIQLFSAFNSIFSNTGLFGIYGSTSPDFASKAVDIAVEKLTLVAKHEAGLLTSLCVLLTIVAEDIGRQILTLGERKSVLEFLDMVDEVTPQSIATTAEKIISSPLTMASYGNVINVPSYDSVNSRFHAK